MKPEPGALPRRVTIRDVARASGTSISTVSVALSGRRGVSDETRERVVRMANRLGWRPDRRASILRRQDSHLVGVVYEVEQSFQAMLIDALYTAAAERGLELSLAGATPHHDERVCVTEMLRDRCQAVVLTGSGLADAEIAWLARRLPTVSLCRRVEVAGVDAVASDDEMGLSQAVDHLVRLGHRAIVHVDGGTEHPLSPRRAAAYRLAMDRHGLTASAQVLQGGTVLSAGVEAARRIATMEDIPTAVVCFNDVLAASLVHELRALGIAVPGEISVVGYDDGPEARDPSTLLTTVAQDPLPLARATIGFAQRRIEAMRVVPEGEEALAVLPTGFVARATSGPSRFPATDGDRLRRATAMSTPPAD